jgi:hypothetical protein
VGVQDADRRFEFVAFIVHWLFEVAVIRYDYGQVVSCLETVDEQVAGKVYVRALLLGLPDLGVCGLAVSVFDEPSCRRAGDEAPVVDREFGNRCKRTKVDLLSLCLLSLRLGGVARSRSDARREVLDPDDIGIVAQHSIAEYAHVQPPLGGVLQTSVVEVEAVDVDDRTQPVLLAPCH